MFLSSLSQPCRRAAAMLASCLPVAAIFTGLSCSLSSSFASGKPSTTAPQWNAQAAAHYLDDRELFWQSWDRAKKDQGTLCVSCHTQATYGLARPLLRRHLAEPAISTPEQVMQASIQKRVRLWDQMAPFYNDATSGAGKEVESRNAESVLNAIILSSYDRFQGHLSPTTRTAFDHAWALQSTSGPTAGAWVWQNFHYAPWESPESEYHGAALMAVAVAQAPDDYKNDPAVATHLAALIAYLGSHYGAQPLLNKVVALRASKYFTVIMTTEQRQKLLAELQALQRPGGGWSLKDLGEWKRVDETPLESQPDGYATGLIVLTLEEIDPHPAHNPLVKQGRAWLMANQDKSTGAWPAWSVNKKRDPASNVGKFMTDAATSYAVMALEAGR